MLREASRQHKVNKRTHLPSFSITQQHGLRRSRGNQRLKLLPLLRVSRIPRLCGKDQQQVRKVEALGGRQVDLSREVTQRVR